MKRSLDDFDYEIVSQVLLVELCFDICNEIQSLPIDELRGRGSDFLPFYYNLNFSKAIIALNSLLISQQSTELSITNYIKKYRHIHPGADISNFETEVREIEKLFREIFPFSMRNKVSAHVDQEFKHTDFTNGYTLPDSLDKLKSVTEKLKDVFLGFVGHAKYQRPHENILKQSKAIISKIVEDSQREDYTL